MKSPLWLRGCAAIGASLAAAALATAPAASASTTPAYNTGLAIGTQAYEYGVPLLDTQRVYSTSTSVNVPDGLGHGPVNQFSNIRVLATASERTVNAPNRDTLYSTAWLNLSKQPMVLHAPAIKHRFWEFELLDSWTNNFYNITSVPTPLGHGSFGVTGGGNWAVVGPDFKGKLPHGVKRIDSKYNRVWIIGRTFVAGQADLASVHRIQNEYSITPLSKFGTDWKPTKPKHPNRTVHNATIPGTQPGENPLNFYVALGKEMQLFPAPARDNALLAKLRPYGIGPGLSPLKAHLSADTLHGLADAVTQGPAAVQTAALKLYLTGFAAHHGYLVSDLGNWGTNYQLRAIGDKIGLGGQRANIATYPVALLDDTKAPLNGSKRYVLHIPKSSLPIPVSAFWSLTMYDSNSFFVANPLNRYLLNDLSHLHKNADGSIDIYVQHDKPTNPDQVSNWLPAPGPGQGFRLIWRLYGLGDALTGVLNGTGWEPPFIQPCDSAGQGNQGTVCAS
jgi:hypothetical protein